MLLCKVLRLRFNGVVCGVSLERHGSILRKRITFDDHNWSWKGEKSIADAAVS